MKNSFLFLIVGLTLFGLNTIFAIEAESPGGYGGVGGPLIKVTSIKGETLVGIGGIGYGVLDRFLIGGMGVVLHKNQDYIMGYGGMYVGYKAFDSSAISVIPSMVLGYGTYFSQIRDTSFILVEPGVEIHVKWSPYVESSLGLSYRLAGSDADLSGGSVTCGIQFGFVK